MVKYWLHQNRSMDQILLCSIYMIGKTLQKKSMTFANITDKYAKIVHFARFPAANDISRFSAEHALRTIQDVLLRVPMTLFATDCSTQPKLMESPTTGHLLAFYNEIYSPSMHNYAFDLCQVDLITFPGIDKQHAPSAASEKSNVNKSESMDINTLDLISSARQQWKAYSEDRQKKNDSNRNHKKYSKYRR